MARFTPVSRSNGIVIFQNGDTLREPVGVAGPANRVYAGDGPVGERVFTAADVKYVDVERPCAFRQHTASEASIPPNSSAWPARPPTFLLTATASRWCSGLLKPDRSWCCCTTPAPSFNARPLDNRPPDGPAPQRLAGPALVGFLPRHLATSRVAPFRCSLAGLLRVLPYYHKEVKRFAWQYPTATVRMVISYYNSLETPGYYEPLAPVMRRELRR